MSQSNRVVISLAIWILLIFALMHEGNFPFGWAFMVGGIAAALLYATVGRERLGGAPITPANGKLTFSWKGLEVYGDDGFFCYRGRQYDISAVQSISYQTSGRQGCFGGTHYLIYVHLNDINTPRITLSSGNISHNGNRETEENYERLGIALRCGRRA